MREITILASVLLLLLSMCNEGNSSDVGPSLPDTRAWLDRRSSVVSNLFVLVSVGNSALTPDDRLVYAFYSANTNQYQVYLPPTGQHLCKIEMLDEKGESVPKTKLAAETETHFVTTTNVFRAGEVRSKTGWKHLSPYVASPPEVGGAGRLFYRPNELFEITKPGSYLMKMQFQVFKPELYRRGSSVHIITFPVIEIPIVVAEAGVKP